ncbi:MAG: ABC transporter substrate-binding protein [Acidimicrobiaceae bacterium]|jgi:peptide/nickel transport system substrate-binding protein|nr:ABC transporter substrate-binding protein [Acidimicrobiaceae bacterium]MBT5580622.1 ABC transporter substrate-binding protein [Acidimicrobiaceae bacterium]MBT5850226.1 ABC transporter substrate-binding protein [Acidimicrobiaceae bacterium]
MKLRSLYKLLALLLVFGMFTAACGSDDDDSAGDDAAVGDDAAADDAAEEDSDDSSEDETAAAGDEAEGDVDTVVEEDESSRNIGGEIAVGLEAETTGMRPWEDTCSSPCYNILDTIYDRLMEPTATGNYGGKLYVSIAPNEDFTVWTAVLREGVTFHNGKALTAQSIADMFPVQQAGAAGAAAVSSANVADVQASGDFEVTYTLSQASSAFPAFLSRAGLGMVFDAEFAAADPDGYNENPVGTGAFVFESRDIDNETIVVRNDNYWMSDADGNQLPYLDKISFRPIPDEGTRLDATLSGTTQVAHTLRQGTIRDARAERDDGADIFLYEFQGNNTGGGMYNVLTPPFDDVRVRRGLVMMNSQENVIEALGGTGISLPATQWFSPDSPWYSEKVAAAWPQFDFELGQATLQEYIDDPDRSDGKAVGELIDAELSCPPDPTLIAAMQVIEQVWTASGLVNTTMTNYDQQTHIGYALGSPDDGFVGSHTTHCWRWADDNDPSTFLNPAFAPPTAAIAEAAGVPGVVSPYNFANYFSGSMFTNLIAATKTDVFEERYALYEAVMMELAEQVPVWYSGHTATALIVDSSIQGLASWILPDGTLGQGLPNAEGRWSQAWLD